MGSEQNNAETLAYEGVIRLILEGRIPPGFPLVEQQVAEELGLSRTPVRNALRRLAAEGLLENRTGRSCVLPGLSRKDLEDLYRVRLIAEPWVAYDAARQAGEEEREVFENLILRERECYFSGDPKIYEVNKDLHLGIARLTGNRHMEHQVKQLFWRCELYVLFFDNFFRRAGKVELLRDPDRSKSHREHRDLVRAIFENRPNEAKEIMEDHIHSTVAMLLHNSESLRAYGGVSLLEE